MQDMRVFTFNGVAAVLVVDEDRGIATVTFPAVRDPTDIQGGPLVVTEDLRGTLANLPDPIAGAAFDAYQQVVQRGLLPSN
jgi:hypothetical protein